MSATKAFEVHADLTNAVLSALRNGMTRKEVLAAVQQVAELLENSDDD